MTATILQPSELQVFADKLLRCKTVLLSSHLSPDADSIGSVFAAASLLIRRGIEAEVYLVDEIPERFKPFFEGETELPPVIHAPPTKSYDAVFVLDTASRPRIGRDAEAVYKQGAQIFNLDHHISNPNWGDVNLVDGNAAATAVLVTELADCLDLKLGRYEANLLYAGLTDDTGGFGFSNANLRAFHTGGRLVEAGAAVDFVNISLHYSMPEKAVRFQGYVVAKLEILLDGRAAYAAVTDADLEKFDILPDHVEGLIDVMRKVGGPKVVLLQRQVDDGWKFSLRSKDAEIDVNKMAAVFGGGGHKMAAGCTIKGSEREAKNQLIAVVKEALSK